MKLLSIAIPCYNSEAYMEKCIQSLLPGGDEVEILVIDDGSKDRTAEISEHRPLHPSAKPWPRRRRKHRYPQCPGSLFQGSRQR